jgi:hypothetical protein
MTTASAALAGAILEASRDTSLANVRTIIRTLGWPELRTVRAPVSVFGGEAVASCVVTLRGIHFPKLPTPSSPSLAYTQRCFG